MEVESPAPMAPGLGVDGYFTEADLAAADQLVQLSVSGGPEAAAPTSSSRSARSVNNTETAAATEMADQLVQLSASGGPEAAASPTSSSLSARSVNNAVASAGREDDHRDDDGVVDRRARKRYRRVAELYHATRPAKRGGAGGKWRRDDGDRRDRRQIDRPNAWVCV